MRTQGFLVKVTPGMAAGSFLAFPDRLPGLISISRGRASISSSRLDIRSGDLSCFAKVESSGRICRSGVKASFKAEVQEGLDDEVDSLAQRDSDSQPEAPSTSTPNLDKELAKAVRKTAATFAPRSSTARKNPATPGSTLYTVFEVQAYGAMALGGVLSFNLLFPSNEPDIWRLMGMWSVWMFTIPSLRARDCSSKEKEALNYLFLAVPLINVALPIVWKSFAAVWSADVLAFLAIYAWKVRGSGAFITDSIWPGFAGSFTPAFAAFVDNSWIGLGERTRSTTNNNDKKPDNLV